MTLSDIEITLDSLFKRHPDLTKELLTTLLVASSWEEQSIKEALMLFDGHVLVRKAKEEQEQEKEGESATSSTSSLPEEVVPLPSHEKETDIVFYTPDGETERPVDQSLLATPVPPRDKEAQHDTLLESHDDKHLDTEITKDTSDLSHPEDKIQKSEGETVAREDPPATSPQVTSHALAEPHEPQSLIVHPSDRVAPSSVTGEKDIPPNLPLLPFESSPYVWSFAKYKDAFHKEKQEAIQPPAPLPEPPVFKETPTLPQKSVSGSPLEEKVSKGETIVKKENEENEEEISLEKTPMTAGDESLVFLAGFMLVAILLILGYMYGNGRL